MVVEAMDQCPECHRYALIVESVSDDLQRWVLVCDVCGETFEEGQLER